MKAHLLRVHSSEKKLAKEKQLAWKLATCALDKSPISEKASEMLINRMIDNMAVAVASLDRKPVKHARDQALLHPLKTGATIIGVSNEKKFFANWCAWANGVAVRELDFHDTFLAADYSHPADNIPPVLAVAQQKSCSGADLLRALLSSYEIHISLVKAICLHKHKVDHIAHLLPSQVAGIGALLSMDQENLFQAINQAVHLAFTTRQSRKGEISSWKAYAPAHAGKTAIEAVDRALRGEKSPSPIYEGEDSVIAHFLAGPDAQYEVFLPEKGEEKKAILESYTKEYSAEYQSQALIDLAFEIRKKITDLEAISEIKIHTSHHTHYVIGSGSKDPQKQDPKISRETLDHSISYIFAVALEDGFWHHEKSYETKRASKEQTLRLWEKIKTVENKKWTELYHHPNPNERSFGAHIEIFFKDGSKISAEKRRAKAHPAGERPFQRKNYIQKFMELSESTSVREKEKKRFLSLVTRLPELNSKEVKELNVQCSSVLPKGKPGLLDE